MNKQAVMNHYENEIACDEGGKINRLRLRRLSIDTYHEAVIYMREDCSVCRSEGFEAQSRILVKHNTNSIIATLNVVKSNWLAPGEASLSEAAWRELDAEEGQWIELSHPPPLESLSKVRAKIYGKHLSESDYREIIRDITENRYSDIDLSAFITACAGERMEQDEIISLTKAMIDAGERLNWQHPLVMDKHCVGGLPGNRTTLLIVPIITAFGLTMPKTSSRAITSPAGTADTMETLAPVNLSLKEMQQVVEKEGGCVVWGGAVKLSPADDILIRIERALSIDSEGQLIASVLSKKAAAGSTHIILDIPVGETAKIRGFGAAQKLSRKLKVVGEAIGLKIQTIISDGSQPVGRGIGPALEARDILAVLQNEKNAPEDLRERALILAGYILEMSGQVAEGQGKKIAQKLLETGRAWEKFLTICESQGGLREPPRAKFTEPIVAQSAGVITAIDNRRLSQVAKLSGAPRAQSAGVEFYTPIGTKIEVGQPLYTIHAETAGELTYALEFVKGIQSVVNIERI